MDTSEHTKFVNDSAKEAWERANEPEVFVGRTGEEERQARREQNRETIRQFAQDAAQVAHAGFTTDAVDPSGAYHLARDLEYEYNEVLREEYAPNNGLSAFPKDMSVPAGARHHSVKRISHSGNARIYRGRSEPKGSVGAQKAKETFPVLTYVTEIELDFFERQADSFAGTNLRSELEIAAEQVLLNFLNEKTFEGSPPDGLPGIWDYPYLPKTFTSVSFDGTANPEDMLNELHRISTALEEYSKGTFNPTALATSYRIKNVLSRTKRSGTTDETVLEAFLDDDDQINEIVPMHEAKGIGPNGEDAMLFYDKGNKMSIANTLVQGFNMLPIQRQGFDLTIPCYIQHGGIIMRNALNNLLCYADGGS